MGVQFPGKKRYVTLEWPLGKHNVDCIFLPLEMQCFNSMFTARKRQEVDVMWAMHSWKCPNNGVILNCQNMCNNMREKPGSQH